MKVGIYTMRWFLVLAVSLVLLAGTSVAGEPRGFLPGGCRPPETERETLRREPVKFPRVYTKYDRMSGAKLTELLDSFHYERLDGAGGIPVSIELRSFYTFDEFPSIVVSVAEPSSFTIRVAYSSRGLTVRFGFRDVQPGDYILDVSKLVWTSEHAVVTLVYEDAAVGRHLVDWAVIAAYD